MTIEHRIATPEDLKSIWNMNIEDNPDEPAWIGWKQEYMEYNHSGKGLTFVVVCDGRPVGEGTLLFSPDCAPIRGRTQLADSKTTANINALRIRKEYEGKGYISALIRRMENYATAHGYLKATIGVEADQTRNLGIYLHWGYDRFVMDEKEGGSLILYYAKPLVSNEDTIWKNNASE